MPHEETGPAAGLRMVRRRAYRPNSLSIAKPKSSAANVALASIPLARELMPFGLAATMQPCMARQSRSFNPTACALTIAALILPAVLFAPPVQVATRTALLIPALFGQKPDGRDIVSESVSVEGGTMHVYRPSRGQHPALIISLGVEPASPDDPRVVSLLTGLADSGIAAVLVESPSLNAGYITPEAPDLLVSAFERVAASPWARHGRV